MSEKIKHWFSDGVSIDETKVSILIMGFLFSLGFGIYKFHTTGDISDNWLEVIKILVLIIGGVNVADKISGLLNKGGK